MPEAAPLAGITVVELATTIAGPYAGTILAGLGARVIKIESAKSGDPFRHLGGARIDGLPANFQALNGGKASVRADLSDPAQVEAVRQLAVAEADVVLQNMRPGTVERLGLGAADLLEAKPGLVYCNLGAYGREGPMRHLPGYDPLMQAFGGIVALTGTEAEPARVGISLIDMGTGMWAALGILSALLRRAESGRGGIVDVSLFETALAYMGLAITNYEADGTIPERTGLRGPFVAPNRAFEAADGLLVIAVVSDAQFRRLAEALELPALAKDPRFASTVARLANEAALTGEIGAIIKGRGREDWSRRLNAADVPNAPVQGLDEVVDHAQTLATGLLSARGQDPARFVGLPVSLDGARMSVDEPAPELGRDDQLLLPFVNPD
ncbi:MAG: CoA transferase [Alphaproteobacteria bacterium]|jgi:crotonobetainyl-CoA:carnitine CoA-transferase CaiB-like acyl-CoA transferase|nr:CoA transferase [Alphaproteobacteria bacterium]